MRDISLINKLPVRFRAPVAQIISGVESHMESSAPGDEPDTSVLEEIRFRAGQLPELCFGDGLIRRVGESKITDADIRELLNYLTGYSLYAYEDEIRQGYFTIQGGHRIGVAGRASNSWGLSDIGAVNIRVAHEHKGCASPLMPYIKRGDDIYNTLILAQPGVGKTTYLRDCIRLLSNIKVCVVDERSEIAACYRGVPQNDVGFRTDVLDGCPKKQGMRMLLRSMSPQVIAVDELGSDGDFEALYEVMHSGIRVLGTVHAGCVGELSAKPYLKDMISRGQIGRLILLSKGADGRRGYRVYDEYYHILADKE